MTQLQGLLEGLSKLGRTLDKEVPRLYKELDDIPLITNDETSDTQSSNCHIGFYAIKDMEKELISYQKNVSKLKEEIGKFDKFNHYIFATKELVEDLNSQLETTVDYLKNYGYVPMKLIEDVEANGDQNERGSSVDDDNEDKENSVPDTAHTPVKAIPKVDLDKTPDLADFGLSHLKSFKMTNSTNTGHKAKASSNLSNQMVQVSQNKRLPPNDVACTPAQFSHQGFKASPGLFGNSDCSLETPCTPENVYEFFKGTTVEHLEDSDYSSPCLQSSRYKTDTKESAIQNSSQTEVKMPQLPSQRIVNQEQFQSKGNVPVSYKNRYHEFNFNNDTTIDEFNCNHNSANWKDVDEKDLPTMPKMKHERFAGLQTPVDKRVRVQNFNSMMSSTQLGFSTPTEPELKSVDFGNRFRTVIEGNNLNALKNKMEFSQDNTPEEPEFTSNFNYRNYLGNPSLMEQPEENFPQTPELTSTFKQSRVQMAPIPSIKCPRKFRNF